jgi:mRNA-degrading endonuclease toxin of MazEF toxin-antitoxin module
MPAESQTANIVETARARVFVRGEVRWVLLPKQFGVGPLQSHADRIQNLGNELCGKHMCVIVQQDSADANSVVVVPITSAYDEFQQPKTHRHWWVSLEAPSGGVTQKSYVMCEQIRCVDKARVLTRTGELSATRLRKIRGVLSNLLFPSAA